MADNLIRRIKDGWVLLASIGALLLATYNWIDNRIEEGAEYVIERTAVRVVEKLEEGDKSRLK